MNADVVGRAKAALAGSDTTKWAEVTMNGRVATISGKTTNESALGDVVKAVAGTYGVRDVVTTATYEPLNLVAPTIESIKADAPVTEIKGTWAEGTAKALTVTAAGTAYVLGSNPELTSSAGNWLLKLATPLPEGTYDVTASSSVDSDGATVTKAAEAPAQIIVDVPDAVAEAAPAAETDVTPPATAEPEPVVAPADTTAPVAPTVIAVAVDVVESRSLTGTYDAADTAKLMAKFQGREYVLGRGQALAAGETAGTFVFAPNTARLAPGKYDVDFTAHDAAGNVSAFAAPQSIIIPEPPKVMEPAPEAAPEPAPVAVAEAAPALALPTVAKQLDLTGAPIIKGTWPEADATKLVVTVGRKSYRLGSDANIASDGKGNWRLLPSVALADGTYNVVATASNADRSVSDAAVDDLTVDATPPAAPTAVAYASNISPTSLSGTFDVAHAKSVKVALPDLNISAELGAAGSALTADAAGNWTLALAQPIPPGTYNVTVTTADEHGRVSEDASAGEVIVSAPDQPAPKVDRPFDCEAVMTRISSVFPMRFIYDKIDFDERFGLSVSQYAALLKDPRCAAVKVELGGHADSRGSESYNEDLAERRAAKVRDMIVEAGVDGSRLSVASYGESQPVDTSENEAAWSKNRRVDVKIMK